MNIFSIFFNTKVYCGVFSSESPSWGDSVEDTQHTMFNIKKKITLNYPKSAALEFFPTTQERARNFNGERAICVRATKVLLYLFTFNDFILHDSI